LLVRVLSVVASEIEQRFAVLPLLSDRGAVARLAQNSSMGFSKRSSWFGSDASTSTGESRP
jgi:hypothetical protein